MLNEITGIKVIVIFLFFISGNISSQVRLETGKIAAEVNEFGRIRIHAPFVDNFRQIDRVTLLIANGPNEIYSYMLNSAPDKMPDTVKRAYQSDMELQGTFEFVKDSVRKFIVKQNIYSWNKEPFIVVKFSVLNDQDQDVTAYIGMEIIPQLENEYGLEKVKFDKSTKTLEVYKRRYMGFRYLTNDSDVCMSYSDWYYDYFNEDTTLFKWLTNELIDTSYIATEKGSILNASLQPQTILAHETATVYLAISYGAYEDDLLDNLTLAAKRFKIGTNVQVENVLPEKFSLGQNYPNPFNLVTTIEYTICTSCLNPSPYQGEGNSERLVILKVYDILGREVSTLIEEEKKPGSYKVTFNAEELPSGIYFYKLTTGEFTQTRKLVLLK